MILRPPRAPRTEPLFPSTTRFRSPAPRDQDQREQRARQVEARTVQPAPMTQRPAAGKDQRAACDQEQQQGQRQALREHAQHAATGQIAERERRSEEHTSELQSLMRISYAVFCLQKKKNTTRTVT